MHPGAKWFNAGDKGRLWEISQQRIAANLQRNARSRMPQSEATMKIVAIDITAGVASAKIETEYLTNAPPELMPKLAGKGSRVTEYLSLIKFDDGLQLDLLAAWSLVPYLLYRVYAVWWGYAVWKANM